MRFPALYTCVYRVVNGHASLSVIFGKPRVVLKHQYQSSNWAISRKELEAAKICGKLM